MHNTFRSRDFTTATAYNFFPHGLVLSVSLLRSLRKFSSHFTAQILTQTFFGINTTLPPFFSGSYIAFGTVSQQSLFIVPTLVPVAL
jgi:hypothetical protein